MDVQSRAAAQTEDIMRILVGNLSHGTTRDDLRNLFAEYGEIARVGLAKDLPDGTRRNYGLVEMNDSAEGERAMSALRGTLFNDRPLKVREARKRADRGQN